MSLKSTLPALPIFGLRKEAPSTRELVFRILSRQYPCTINTLRAELQGGFRQKLSYQAVRKSVLVLQGLGMLEQGRGGYRLRREWLVAVRALVDQTLDRYRAPGAAALEADEPHQSFVTGSLYEADTLWGDILREVCGQVPRRRRGRLISVNHYPWWLPLNVGREQEICSQLRKLGFEVWFVFLKSGAASRWARMFYESIKVRVHLVAGSGLPETHYYNVVGDTVIEAVLPGVAVRKVASLFGGGFHAGRLRPEAMTRLAESPCEVRLTVYHNPPLAAGLLQMIRLPGGISRV